MKSRILRRSAAVVAGATAIALISAGVALADVSPTNVAAGDTTMYWSGQGAPVQQMCGSSADPGTGGYANGATPGNYELWIFSTDGGSANGTPTLTVNGTTYTGATLQGSSNWQIVTPYIDPSTITPANPQDQSSTGSAFASFTVQNTGGGNWKLVISHGCAAPPEAQAPTVTKGAAGAFHTTWTWNIQKSVDQNQINTPPGSPATFNYTVVVTPTSSNNDITVAGTIDVTNPNPAPITASSVVDTLSNGVGCQLNWTGTPDVLGSGDTNIPYTCQLQDGTDFSSLYNTVVVNWDTQTLSNGSQLAAGHANFTTPNAIVFTQTQVTNDCIDVTDSVYGDLGSVCASGGPHTFKYPVTYTAGDSNNPAGTCTTHPNVASFTTTGPDSSTPAATGSDNKSVQVCVGQDLNVSKTATPAYQLQYLWNVNKTVDNGPTINTPQGTPATANYTVAVTHDSGTQSNWAVNGVITVTNPNDWEGIALGGAGNGLTDAIDDGGVCTVQTGTVQGGSGSVDPATGNIPAGATVNFPYTCTYNSQPSPFDYTFTNTATASWDASAAYTTDSSANGTAQGNFASVTPKVIDGSATLTDTLEGPLGTFYASQTSPIVLHYQIPFSGTPGACTEYDNTATVTPTDSGPVSSSSSQANVNVCVGEDLGVTKTATPSFQRQYKWTISKAVDNTEQTTSGPATFNYTVSVTHDAGTDSQWQLNGNITVTNPNSWEDIPLQSAIDVPTDPNAHCVLNNGNPVNGILVPRAQNGTAGSVSVPYSCTFTQAPSPGQQTNFATVNWDGSVATGAATPDSQATGSVYYDFSSVNPTIIDGTVVVTDPNAPGNGVLGTAHYNDPTNPINFTYSHTFTGDPAGTCTTHPNTATFTTDTGNTGQASQSVQVCVGADLTVGKTATPSFQRKYDWKITKSANPTSLVDGGTVNYTVKVNQTDFVDSGWQVKGIVTVTNPNNFEAVTTNVTDPSTTNGGTCTFDAGSNPIGVVVPISGSVHLHYTCTYPSTGPSQANGTNTATASWDSGVFGTPDSSASGGANFAFTTPTSTIDKTITVTDPMAPNPPLPATLTGSDDPNNLTSRTFTYSKTFSSPTSGCQVINNTATISTTPPQSSSASVNSCALGALTMGYWHNSNGQGVIKASTGTALSSYLRGFAPFQDLPAGSNSTAVANYFTQVWNSANAGGAQATAMLKAQMLATALDVYFWQQIGAPANIGNVTVNISAWSTAFGGATSMTVSQMLSYASSQLVSGVWYGGNKTLQTTAINAFNAVNNSTVTGP